MARIAVPLLFAFFALLGFLGWMIATRRARQQDRLNELRYAVKQQEKLVNEIYDVAFEAADVDPSAELIIMKISDFKKKELR